MEIKRVSKLRHFKICASDLFLAVRQNLVTKIIFLFNIKQTLNMFTKNNIICTALLCISFLTLNAQMPKWEVGGFLGVSQYQGDISDMGSFDELNGGYGLLVRRHLSSNFALRGNLLFGKMSGKDANITRNASRGFTFESPMSEISIVGEYDLFGHKRYADNKFLKKFSPYVFGGIGLLMGVTPVNNYNLTAASAARKSLITQDQAVAAQSSFIAVPLGAGIKIDLNEQWNLNLEFGKRYTFSDNVDRISKSANPDKSDTYFYGGAILGYRFGAGTPKVAKPRVTTPPVIIDDSKAKADAAAREAAARDLAAKEAAAKELAARELAAREKAAAAAAAEAARLKQDTDGDGVADVNDKCPTVAGTAANNGCPLDTDGDGVADVNDKCPNQAGVASNNGCPEVTREVKQVMVEAMEGVQFETGSSKLTATSYAILNRVVSVMQNNQSLTLAVSGHTDNVGNESNNQKLSASRAAMCMKYLQSKGVSASRMTSAGYGSTQPIDENTTKKGRDRNRRVEFTAQ
jgi:outer membrane protein OmpA-like peptidoglycan-associated protein